MRVPSSWAKFPVISDKFPVLQNIFPVNLSRELSDKSLRHSDFWLQQSVPEAPKPQNSLLYSREFLWRQGDQHCVASQALGPAPVRPQPIAEKPANDALLQFGSRSPASQFPDLPAENAESLWPFIE
jgi:hypothetical protein